MNITSIIRKSKLSNNKYNIINIPEYTYTHISLFVNNVSKSAIIIFLYNGIDLFISFVNSNTVNGEFEKKSVIAFDIGLKLPRSLFCLNTKLRLNLNHII